MVPSVFGKIRGWVGRFDDEYLKTGEVKNPLYSDSWILAP